MPSSPESSPPPPSSGPPGGGWQGAVIELETATGWRARAKGTGDERLTVRASDIVVEHGGQLREPLQLAPGGILAATLDPGPAKVDKGRAVGRFPILHRLSPTAIVPREEGIEGWLWTSTGGSALSVIGDEQVAPNLALLFLQPLGLDVVERVFEPVYLEELAKRSPLGSPTVFGILLRVANIEKARNALTKVGVIRPLTDREVPPTQRRHLPDDKAADPGVKIEGLSRAETSVPPPGIG